MLISQELFGIVVSQLARPHEQTGMAVVSPEGRIMHMDVSTWDEVSVKRGHVTGGCIDLTSNEYYDQYNCQWHTHPFGGTSWSSTDDDDQADTVVHYKRMGHQDFYFILVAGLSWRFKWYAGDGNVYSGYVHLDGYGPLNTGNFDWVMVENEIYKVMEYKNSSIVLAPVEELYPVRVESTNYVLNSKTKKRVPHTIFRTVLESDILIETPYTDIRIIPDDTIEHKELKERFR